jgi:hypothetical protein
MPTQNPYPRYDYSGAVQSTTSHLLKKPNEIKASKNADFRKVVGAITRRDGYEQVGQTIEHGKDGLYAGVYRYGRNHKIIVGVNNSGDSSATLRYLDSDNSWRTILSDADANTRFDCLNSLDEFYVAGASDATYYSLTLVKQDLTTDRTYNVLNAPKCKFIAEFQGILYAINCEVNSVKYPDRAYRSSPPIGAITFIQTDQKGLLKQLRVDSVRYLKAGMTIDIYGAGTEAKRVSALTIISVDKKNNRISFSATSIDVADNDEIWLSGRKGKLTRFWNTDYPTAESSDWIAIPSSEDAETIPEISAYGKNNGRLFLFTPDSFTVFDGSNFTPVSETIGCVAPQSVKNIGTWTLFLHTSGVWGYSDDSGQLRLLSRAVEKYLRAIKPVNYSRISAVSVDRSYKLAIGELMAFESPTTSTSTSSTSTSSTSSSTSSTSTSSTSTSSTSSSTSTSATTSTSTSSTSSSTTSSSTSTSSTSTSSTSTSTTTTASSKQVVRLIYDFDSNTWWPEYHKREFRFQFRHRMHGYKKPYFIDETGRLFRDETGNLDHFDTIPFEVELGRDNFGIPLRKSFHSCLIDAEQAGGVQVYTSIDGGNFNHLGQITSRVNEFVFKFGSDNEGHDINYKFASNDRGEPPVINSDTTYWSPLESQGAAG